MSPLTQSGEPASTRLAQSETRRGDASGPPAPERSETRVEPGTDTIDGGSTEAGDRPFEREQVSLGVLEADHRRNVTLYLIALLAVVVVVHPLLIVVMEWNGKKHDGLSGAFNSILPVVAGLAGSAVTYYFTKNDRR